MNGDEGVTPRLERWIRARFTRAQADTVLARLRGLDDDLGGWYGEQVLAAIAFLGNGDMERFDGAVQLATKLDPRDAIVAAGASPKRLNRVLDLGQEPKIKRRWRRAGNPMAKH